MNDIRCDFPSDVLGTYVHVRVLLPKKRKTPLYTPKPRGAYPVLYLLHGAMDYGDNWMYRTDLAGLVDEREVAVVLPFGGNRFWLDTPEGPADCRFLTEELPGYLGQIFPFSKKREETFLGGLSMGGYGSLYAALRSPGQYGKVFSLSGAVDISRACGFLTHCGVQLPRPLQEGRALGEYDLFALLNQGAALPPVYLACGREDFFLRDNQALAQALEEKNLAVTLQTAPGGHDWEFWAKSLKWAFDFLGGT